MVNIYDNFKDEFGNNIVGRTKLFISSTDVDGNISLYESGIACTPQTNGTMFIVDEWLIPQIDKVKFVDGVLSVKDGEELVPPVKTEKELQIEAIERQLAALKAEPDEPTNATGQLLLENTEPTE